MPSENSVFSAEEIASFQPETPDEILRRHAEPDFAVFSLRLIPCCSRPLLGVRLPLLRQLARALMQQRASVPPIRPTSFEATMLLGYCTALAPGSFSEREMLIDAFLPYIDNWSLCDSFCASLRFPPSEFSLWFDKMERLAVDSRPFFARFAAICSVERFPTQSFGDRMLALLSSVSCGAYYTRMGVAWAGATLYRSRPDEIRSALSAHQFDAWTHNQMIRKICESCTTDPASKELLRTLRRPVASAEIPPDRP